MMSGFVINFYGSRKYHLTAGIFSIPNFYLFTTIINKPIYKFHVFSLGILTSMWFIELKDFKENRNDHPIINYLYRQKYSKKVSCF